MKQIVRKQEQQVVLLEDLTINDFGAETMKVVAFAAPEGPIKHRVFIHSTLMDPHGKTFATFLSINGWFRSGFEYPTAGPDPEKKCMAKALKAGHKLYLFNSMEELIAHMKSNYWSW